MGSTMTRFDDSIHCLSHELRARRLCCGFIRIECHNHTYLLPSDILDVCCQFVGVGNELIIPSKTEIQIIEKEKQRNHIRVLILGLECVGKTTLFSRIACLYSDEIIHFVPITTKSIGFNINIKYQICHHQNIEFTSWNLSSNKKHDALTRYYCSHYHDNTKGIIFVIDSNDKDNLENAVMELYKLLDINELQKSVILIFANKQDISTSMSQDDIKSILQLHRFSSKRIWKIQSSSFIKGDGVMEGIQWLRATIDQQFPTSCLVM